MFFNGDSYADYPTPLACAPRVTGSPTFIGVRGSRLFWIGMVCVCETWRGKFWPPDWMRQTQAGKLLLLFLSASLLVPDCVVERTQPSSELRHATTRLDAGYWMHCARRTAIPLRNVASRWESNVEMRSGKRRGRFPSMDQPKIKIPPRMEHSLWTSRF